MDLLTNQSRSYPSIAEGSSTIVTMLQEVFQSYLSAVKTSHLIADKRDPEFGFYDQTQATVMVYRYVVAFQEDLFNKYLTCELISFSVKPAIFDLFLTLTIAGYLSVVYFGIQVRILSIYLTRNERNKIS